jgi:hypothetical protein
MPMSSYDEKSPQAEPVGSDGAGGTGRRKIGKSACVCLKSDGAVFLATEPGLNALDVFQVPILSWKTCSPPAARSARASTPTRPSFIDTVDNAYKYLH